MRFDRRVRLAASSVFSIQMIIYMALVLYAPALALSQVTGLNVWISVISIGVICTMYTTVVSWFEGCGGSFSEEHIWSVGWYESSHVDRCLSNDHHVCRSLGVSHSRWRVVEKTVVFELRSAVRGSILGIIDAGGSKAVWQRALEGGRVEFFKLVRW